MHTVLGMPGWLLRAGARLVLLALALGTVGPVSHGTHEDDCEPAFVLHDESAHHIQASRGSDVAAPAHCVACHFARSTRFAPEWAVAGVATPDAGYLLSHADGSLIAVLSASPLPARAPPATV